MYLSYFFRFSATNIDLTLHSQRVVSEEIRMLRSEKMQKNISVYPEPAIETCRNFSTRLNLTECIQDIVWKYAMLAIFLTLMDISMNNISTSKKQPDIDKP